MDKTDDVSVWRRKSAERAIIVAGLIDAVGDGIFMVVGVLYYTHVLGLSAALVGIGTTVAGLFGMVVGIQVGRVADRRNATNVYRMVLVCQAVACLLLLIANSFVLFVAFISVTMAAERANRAVRGGLIGRVAAAGERVRVRASVRTFTNLGVAVGSLLGGVVVTLDTDASYRLAIVGNAASYVLALAVLYWVPRYQAIAQPAGSKRSRGLRDVGFLSVTAINAVLIMNVPVITVGLPLWISQHTEAPRFTIALAVLVNTLMVVLLQRRLSSGAETVRGAARKSAIAGGFLLLACALNALTGSLASFAATSVLLVAMVIHSLGEVQQAAAGFGLSYDLAPSHATSEYQGIFGMGNGVANALGSSVVIFLCIELGWMGWLILGAIFCCAGCAVPPIAAWAQRNKLNSTA